MKKLILVLLLSGCAGHFKFENDFLKPSTTVDSFYTQGTQFGYYTETEYEKESYSIGQTIYTPSRKKPDADPEILKNDRPYAGWLYAEFQRRALLDETNYSSFGIQLGCLGPCSFARETQQNFHRLINQGIPTWDPAWSLKSEPGVILMLQRAKQIYAHKNNADVSLYAGTKLGNIVDSLSIGADLRAGYNLDNFASDSIEFKDLEQPWMAYLFSRVETRYVAYNHLLDGSLFQDERHTVTSEDIVNELNLGVSLGYKDFSFTYRYTMFSSEWVEHRGNHAFGSIELKW